MCLKSCQRKLQYCTVHPQVAMKGIYQLDYTGQTHFRVSLAAQRGYLITVWTEADIAWLTHSPESIISLMKPQRSEKTGFVIDDTASEPPEYEHAISYSWFAARSSSRFESSVIFFFSPSLALLFLSCHVVICVRAFEWCLLHTEGPTQYSADKDRERQGLGKDVNGNDNTPAEFIH